MPLNRWKESEISKNPSALSLRVYTSRLLGQDPSLVLHGGGNTSVKDRVKNLFGEEEDVLYIKGSGWDLATIESAGFPAVRMKPLMRLRELNALGDVEMMNELRAQLINTQAPDPSVETLLHAYLPHRFVDHTHANAVLTLTNQPDGEKRIRELYGSRMGIVPYIMPGFLLAKACAEVYESNPKVQGLILLKHGIFSFGDTAKESYDLMLEFVQRAEEWVAGRKTHGVNSKKQAPSSTAKESVTLKIRQELLRRGFPCVLAVDSSEPSLALVNHDRVDEITQRGPVTPDHVIRTKRLPVVIREAEKIPALLDRYATEYTAYFERNSALRGVTRQKLDVFPRVFLVPDFGVVTVGGTQKEANIALDIYRHTAQVLLAAEQIGTYEALPEADIFDVEYWVLEQAKLKLGPKKLPLSGKVAIVTGGSSGIGAAIVEMYLEQGATVHIWDLKENELPKPGKGSGGVYFSSVDVTNRERVSSATKKAVQLSGGIDILVVNAGIFPSSHSIEEITGREWDSSLQVNLSGAFHTVAEVLPWMKNQGTGGDIVFIASKNVPAPGKQAAAYSVAKAGQTQLARVLALEAGAYGIRVNMLHPHLIFDTGIWSPEVLDKRAKSYGMSVEEYKRNNLLKTELCRKDVAKAAFALVSGYFSKTTGAQIPLDGGSERTL